MPTELLTPPTHVAGEHQVFSKGYLPTGIKSSNTNVAVHINRFPLGDLEDNFHVSRVALAMDHQRHVKSMAGWDKWAPWEKAYYLALDAVSYKAGGDQVSGQDGGYLAPEFWSTRWFDLLRSLSVLDRLPITRIPVPYRLGKFPKVTGDVTVAYPGENTSITTSNYTFGQAQYNARKAAVLYNVSNELIRDAPETADDLFRRSTAGAFAVDRDLQAMGGDVTGVPVGLAYNPQVPGAFGSAKAGATGYIPAADAGNGATPTYADFVGFKYNVENLSGVTTVTTGQARCDGIVGNSRVIKTIQSILDTSNRPVWPLGLEADGGFIGVPNWPVAGNTIVPINLTQGNTTDDSFLIGGQWREFVLYECLTLGFDTTTDDAAFKSDQTSVRVLHRWDAGPSHPEAFAVMTRVRA